MSDTLSKKWKKRFLNLAREISTWSKDPSTQVGAVIVDEKRRVLGVGYNGLARGYGKEYEILNDRTEKHKRVIHAEKNCIDNTVASTEDTDIFVTTQPCVGCCHVLAQNGIKKVYFNHNTEIENRVPVRETIAELMDLGIQYELVSTDFQFYE